MIAEYVDVDDNDEQQERALITSTQLPDFHVMRRTMAPVSCKWSHLPQNGRDSDALKLFHLQMYDVQAQTAEFPAVSVSRSPE